MLSLRDKNMVVIGGSQISEQEGDRDRSLLGDNGGDAKGGGQELKHTRGVP